MRFRRLATDQRQLGGVDRRVPVRLVAKPPEPRDGPGDPDDAEQHERVPPVHELEQRDTSGCVSAPPSAPAIRVRPKARPRSRTGSQRP
jgi:hypothetical protein